MGGLREFAWEKVLWIGGKNCSEDVGFWCVEFVVTMGWPLRMRLDEYNAELFGQSGAGHSGGQPLLHGQSGASEGQQQQQDPMHGQSGASGSSAWATAARSISWSKWSF